MSSNPVPHARGKTIKARISCGDYDDKNIIDVSLMVISDALDWIKRISDENCSSPILTIRERTIAGADTEGIKSASRFPC